MEINVDVELEVADILCCASDSFKQELFNELEAEGYEYNSTYCYNTVKVDTDVEIDCYEINNASSYSEKVKLIDLFAYSRKSRKISDNADIEDKMYMMDKEECEFLEKLIEKYRYFG